MNMLTNHASIRSQQRGIPPLIIDLIMDYGRSNRRNGADVYSLDKKSRKAIRKHIGAIVYSKLKSLFDTYVVVADDGKVITAAKRFKNLKG